MQVRHNNCRNGQHKTRHDLLGIIIEFGVGKRNAGTVDCKPSCPFDSHHQGTHAEDHPQDVHVVWSQVVGRVGLSAIIDIDIGSLSNR